MRLENFFDEGYFTCEGDKRGNFSLLDVEQKHLDRLKFIVERIDTNKTNKILELGGGAGPFARVAKRTFPGLLDVVVSDITDTGIKLLPENERPNFVKASAYEEPFEESSLDGVVAWDILEHIDNPSLAIKIAFRMLREGGFIHIVCPNPYSWAKDSDADSYYRDKSHVIPPIATVRFFFEEFKKLAWDGEVLTRGFKETDALLTDGEDEVKFASEDPSGTHIIVFARKK